MARFEVNIAGHSLKLRSNHEVETVNELVRIVDSKVRKSLELGAQGSIQNAAILAALQLAEELMTLKRRALKEIERIEEKARKLSSDLENSKYQKGESSVAAELPEIQTESANQSANQTGVLAE